MRQVIFARAEKLLKGLEGGSGSSEYGHGTCSRSRITDQTQLLFIHTRTSQPRLPRARYPLPISPQRGAYGSIEIRTLIGPLSVSDSLD